MKKISSVLPNKWTKIRFFDTIPGLDIAHRGICHPSKNI
jgi:hypothetical protein